MSSLRDDIREKVKDILEKEKDENVLRKLSEDLTPYQLQLARESKKNSRLRPDFSERELEEINEAYERSKNSENLESHEEVMKKLWNRLEKYSGKEGQNSA